jgi:hypothetical protein
LPFAPCLNCLPLLLFLPAEALAVARDQRVTQWKLVERVSNQSVKEKQ